MSNTDFDPRPMADQPPQPPEAPQPPQPPDTQPPGRPVPIQRIPVPPAQRIQTGRGFQHFVGTPQTDEPWTKRPWAAEAMVNNPEIRNTPFAPSPREGYSVIGVAGGQLGKWSAPAVAQPMNIAAGLAGIIGPFLDFYSNNAFSTAYRNKMLGGQQIRESNMRMQLTQMEINRERMLQNLEQGLINEEIILGEYEAVFDRKKNDPNFTDEEAEKAIIELNTKHNHHVLDAVVHNGGLGAVENMLKSEVQRYKDLILAQTSLRESGKKTPGEPEPDTWMQGGGSAGGLRPGERPLPFKGQETTGAATGAAAAADPTAGITDADFMKRYGVNQEGVDAGRQIAEDGQVTGLSSAQGAKEHSKGYRAAQSIGSDIQAAANKVALGAGNTDQKLDNLAKVDPVIADRVNKFGTYQEDTNKLTPAMKQKYKTWTSGVFGKDWNENHFKDANKFWDERDPGSRVVRSAASIIQPAINILDDLHGRSETSVIAKNTIDFWRSEHWDQDPQWAKLGNDLQQFVTYIQAMQQEGTPRASIINHMLDRLPVTATPAAIREVMQHELNDAWARFYPQQAKWDQFGQKGIVPGFGVQEWRDFSALLRFDAKTGKMPQGVSPELRAVSKDSPSTPPTVQIARNTTMAITEIESNPNFDNPSSPEYAQLHNIYDRLTAKQSIVRNPPWMRPWDQ